MSTVLDDTTAKRRIAANVQHFLDLLGWSQADLARATGENEMTISFLVRGVKMPGAALLARVAEALNTTTDAILGMPRKKTSKKPA
jgi:transcriptional regulator with XRE-family HTH domain